MKLTLSRLFDYQKFQKNPRLATIIADAETRCGGAISDDELYFVSAAGEAPSSNPSDDDPEDL